MNATDQYTEDGGESIDFTRDEAFRWIDVALSIGIPALLICGIAGWSLVAGCLSQIVN